VEIVLDGELKLHYPLRVVLMQPPSPQQA